MAQYTTDENLAKRIAIHSYSVAMEPFTRWYNRHVEIPDGARLLDIGCGNAYRWSESPEIVARCSEIVLADSSEGMLEAARKCVKHVPGPWRFEVADVCDMPFESNSFQVVMANHMLYHAGDVDQAIGEIARVLATDGVLYATTNGLGHMAQLGEWLSRSGLAALSRLREYTRRFGVENGAELLGHHFVDVEYWPRNDYLKVPSVEPVLDYVRSMEPDDDPDVRDGLKRFERLLAGHLCAYGTIRIDKHGGLFRARGPVKR